MTSAVLRLTALSPMQQGVEPCRKSLGYLREAVLGRLRSGGPDVSRCMKSIPEGQQGYMDAEVQKESLFCVLSDSPGGCGRL